MRESVAFVYYHFLFFIFGSILHFILISLYFFRAIEIMVLGD